MESSDEPRFAVITGASSGIGFALAEVFGENGFDLLIAAEDDELDRAASELTAIAPSVESVRVDLSRPPGVEQLYERKELRLIDLNVRSTVHLCKLVLADMVARDEGRILITSSVASLMPGPTDTEFFERAEMEDAKVGAEEKDDPAEVARQGYEALIDGKERVVGGSFKNKLQVAASGLVPDAAKAEMHRRMAEPGTGEEAK